MKIIKFLLLVIAILVVIVLLVALFVPKQYHVERSVTIHSPQSLVMDQVRSLKKMHEWSPWVERDTNMQVTYSGTEGTVGSSTSWKGEKMGEGSQTITKLTNDRMEIQLDFIKPFKSNPTSFFQTQPEGADVKATWGMDGKSPYPFNVMNLFMNGMLGKDYERGLAKLKVRCEEMAKSGQQ